MNLIWVPARPELKSAMKAAGAMPVPGEVPMCPFMAGDIVTFPDAPRLAFRVASRWFRSADSKSEAKWHLFIEQCPHPLNSDGPPPQGQSPG